MNQQEARAAMDAITHGPNGLRDNFSPAQRIELDRLRPLAFPDEKTAPTRGVRIGGKDYAPTASRPEHDFYPREVVEIIREKDPNVRKDYARALRAQVKSATAMNNRHPFWDTNSGDHQGWQLAMVELDRIAFDE